MYTDHCCVISLLTYFLASSIHLLHGRPQDFFQGWTMRGSKGRKFPSGVQRQLPSGGLGTKPPEADDNFSK